MSTIAKPSFKDKYDNFIGGKFVPPVKGEYFDNISPIDGKVFTTGGPLYQRGYRAGARCRARGL
jgi:hypothetical protein